MKVLVAVKGTEGESFFRRLVSLGALTVADVVLLAHVVDVEPRSGVEGGRERFMVRRTLGSARTGQIELAEEARAQAVLRSALRALIDGGVKQDRIQDTLLRGKPRESLRELAERESVDLIVLGGRSGPPGPHSVGKTARFLLDHAPRAALLVR